MLGARLELCELIAALGVGPVGPLAGVVAAGVVGVEVDGGAGHRRRVALRLLALHAAGDPGLPVEADGQRDLGMGRVERDVDGECRRAAVDPPDGGIGDNRHAVAALRKPAAGGHHGRSAGGSGAGHDHPLKRIVPQVFDIDGPGHVPAGIPLALVAHAVAVEVFENLHADRVGRVGIDLRMGEDVGLAGRTLRVLRRPRAIAAVQRLDDGAARLGVRRRLGPLHERLDEGLEAGRRGAPEDRVGTEAGVDFVVARPTLDPVDARAPLDHVVAIPAEYGSIATRGHDPVAAGAADQEVVAEAAGDLVHLEAAAEAIGALRAHEHVRIGSSLEERCVLEDSGRLRSAPTPAGHVVHRHADVGYEAHRGENGTEIANLVSRGIGPDVAAEGVEIVPVRSAPEEVGSRATLEEVAVATGQRRLACFLVAPECVVAVIAEELVIALLADERVVALAAENRVVAAAGVDVFLAEQPVVAIAAEDRVAVTSAVDRVVAGLSCQVAGILLLELDHVTGLVFAVELVGALVAEDRVSAAEAKHEVVAPATVQFVVAPAAEHAVAAVVAKEVVLPGAARDPVVPLAAMAKHGLRDLGGDRHDVLILASVEPDEIEVLLVERLRLQPPGLDDHEVMAIRVDHRQLRDRIDRLHDLELLRVVLDAVDEGPGAHVQGETLAPVSGSEEHVLSIEVRGPQLGVAEDDLVPIDDARQRRRGVGASLRGPVEEPDVEQVHAGAEERDEAERRVETELQVGGEEGVERALEVEDAFRALVVEPLELVEVHLAIAIGIAEVRADRAPHAPFRPRLRDHGRHLRPGTERGGEAHLGRVDATVHVVEVDAVDHLRGPDAVAAAGQCLPDAPRVVAHREIRAEPD